jgi:hypothetical protein
MEDAAKSTGKWLVGTAGTVGGGVATGAVAVAGVATAAETVLRPFRSVDIDGDGIPDEPQAFTAVKSVGGAISGKAGSVGGQRGRALQAEEARRTESLRVRCRKAGSAREMTRTKEVVLLRNVMVEFRFNV